MTGDDAAEEPAQAAAAGADPLARSTESTLAKWSWGKMRFPDACSQAQFLRPPNGRYNNELYGSRLYAFIIDFWKLRPPNVLFSITGGARDVTPLDEHGREDVTTKFRLKQFFSRVIAQVAAEENAWIISGGSNTGVMHLAGKGVRDRGRKSVCLGISSAPMVKGADELKDGFDYSAVSVGADEKMCMLDPNHSHHILVPSGTGKDVSDFGDEVDFTIDFQKQLIALNNRQTLLVLANGGINSLRTVVAWRREKGTIIILKGTGRVADVLADLHDEDVPSLSSDDERAALEKVLRAAMRRHCQRELENDWDRGEWRGLLEEYVLDRGTKGKVTIIDIGSSDFHIADARTAVKKALDLERSDQGLCKNTLVKFDETDESVLAVGDEAVHEYGASRLTRATDEKRNEQLLHDDLITLRRRARREATKQREATRRRLDASASYDSSAPDDCTTGTLSIKSSGRRGGRVVRETTHKLCFVAHPYAQESEHVLLATLDAWREEYPRTVLEVTGNETTTPAAGSGDVVSHLVDLARKTRGWIVSDGTAGGVSGLLGDVNRAANADDRVTMLAICAAATTRSDGLTFENGEGKAFGVAELGSAETTVALHAGHTHFFCVGGAHADARPAAPVAGAPVTKVTGRDHFHRELAWCLNTVTPYVLVVIGGELDSRVIYRVLAAVRQRREVRLVEGSGFMADFLLAALNEAADDDDVDWFDFVGDFVGDEYDWAASVHCDQTEFSLLLEEIVEDGSACMSKWMMDHDDFLLDDGQAPNGQDRRLARACHNGFFESARRILRETLAEAKEVGARESESFREAVVNRSIRVADVERTPVQLLLQFEFEQVKGLCLELVRAGARLDGLNLDQHTALMLMFNATADQDMIQRRLLEAAANQSNEDLILRLFRQGCKLNRDLRDDEGKKGITALSVALSRLCIGTARTLMELGAEIDHTEPECIFAAMYMLHHLAQLPSSARKLADAVVLCRLLLASGVSDGDFRVGLNSGHLTFYDPHWADVLRHAARFGDAECIRQLRKRGVEPPPLRNAPTDAKMDTIIQDTPLGIAIERRDGECISALLEDLDQEGSRETVRQVVGTYRMGFLRYAVRHKCTAFLLEPHVAKALAKDWVTVRRVYFSRRLSLYLLFLVVLVAVALFGNARDHLKTFHFANTLRGKLLEEEYDLAETFHQINTVDEVWKWITGPMMRSVFADAMDDSLTSMPGDLGHGMPVDIDEFEYDTSDGSDGGTRLAEERQQSHVNGEPVPFRASWTSTNRVVGAVRIMQHRYKARRWMHRSGVDANASEPLFGWHHRDAVQGPSPEAGVWEDHRPFGPGGIWQFKAPPAETVGAFFPTEHGNYPAGGYAVDLKGPNVTEHLETVTFMRDNGFLDDRTGSLWVEMAVYNMHLDRIGVFRIGFEFPLSGGVVPSALVRTFKLREVETMHDLLLLVGETVLLAITLIWGHRFLSDFRERPRTFLARTSSLLRIDPVVSAVDDSDSDSDTASDTDAWSVRRATHMPRSLRDRLEVILNVSTTKLVDLLLVVLTLVLVYYKFIFWQRGSTLRLHSSAFDFLPLMPLAEVSERERSMTAIVSLLTWLQLLNRLRVFKFFGIFLLIIRELAGNVARFLVIFAIFIVGLAQAFHVGMGHLFRFRSFYHSIVAVFLMVFGEIGADEIVEGGGYLGPILLITTLTTLSVILLNLLIALLNDSYTNVKERASQKWELSRAQHILDGTASGHELRMWPVTERLADRLLTIIDFLFELSVDDGDDLTPGPSTSEALSELRKEVRQDYDKLNASLRQLQAEQKSRHEGGR